MIWKLDLSILAAVSIIICLTASCYLPFLSSSSYLAKDLNMEQASALSPSCTAKRFSISSYWMSLGLLQMKRVTSGWHNASSSLHITFHSKNGFACVPTLAPYDAWPVAKQTFTSCCTPSHCTWVSCLVSNWQIHNVSVAMNITPYYCNPTVIVQYTL